MDDIETIERKITGAWQVISPDNYNGEMQIYVSIIERHIIFKSSLHDSSVIAFDRDMFTLATNNGEIHLTRQNTKDVFTILFLKAENGCYGYSKPNHTYSCELTTPQFFSN